MSSVYHINKGVGMPVVFRGLKGQYIWWLALGLGLLLVVFALLYIAGASVAVCMVLVLVLGGLLFRTVYRLSHHYGEHGMMKKLAHKATPKWIRCNQIFEA
ncbi:MAG: DUF4133 domain-containing protein [Sphingobacteriia bacterium]|nr:DUF4133 domain-containing protein [Sphingobacteriia bacterium]